MQTKNQKAFTILELVFVIVVIGILSAIALPRFSDTADTAYLTKAQSTVASVRAALATERQKRILRGDTTKITDLSLSKTGGTTTHAFDHFSADGQTTPAYAEVLRYPIKACSGTQRACWTTSAGTGTADKMYSYRFPNSTDGNDGKADFKLENNRLDCTDTVTADCELITQ